MHLQDAIKLHILAGGPGSGCHGSNCGRPTLKFYHGTSERAAKQIQRKGLLPGNKPIVKESRQGYVYLTPDKAIAEHFANTYHDKPAIVELDVPADVAARFVRDKYLVQVFGRNKLSEQGYMHKGAIDKGNVAGVLVPGVWTPKYGARWVPIGK